MLRIPHILSVLLCSQALIACDAATVFGPAPPAAEAEAPATWTQLRFSRAAARHGDTPWAVDAWFAEYASMDLGSLQDAMGVIASPEAGCVVMPDAAPPHPDARLQLRAVGASAAQADDEPAQSLAPRALSVTSDAIRGVVYTGSVQAAGGARQSLLVRGPDGQVQSRATIDAPSGLGVVAINGARIDDARELRIDADRALVLQVDTDATTTFAVVRSGTAASSPRVLCTSEDDQIRLTPALLDSFGQDGSVLDVTVVMRNERGLRQGGVPQGTIGSELHDRLRLLR